MNERMRAAGAAGLALVLGLAVLQTRRLRVAVSRARRLPPRIGVPVDAPATLNRRGRAGPSVLLIGDSTALGVGVADARETVAARLGRRYPDVQLTLRARVGATITDAIAVCEQALARGERHALVLLMIGGNDVLHSSRMRRADRGVPDRLAALASRLGRRAVWLGCGNIGLSPVFLPPVSWWVRWRGRRTVASWADACARNGVTFVDLWSPRSRDPFARRPARYYAADWIHPSGASHAVAFRRLERSVPLAHWLGPVPDTPPGDA